MAEGARDTITIACQHSTFFQVEAGARGVARVYCRNKRCKLHQAEITVHHFDLSSGTLVETRRYARPGSGDQSTL